MESKRLSAPGEFACVAEINPPDLPTSTHLFLEGAWDRVLVTDNVFGKIRVSPYAFAARITHDVPTVSPTVVVSTRDRNILAIESEVRGALGNGVESFLVVVGDTVPQVDHLAHHYEIVQHLRELQNRIPTPFEVGMPTRLRRWQMNRRIDLGAQFFVAGPVVDPDTVARSAEMLGLGSEDPPVYLMISPPFSAQWLDRVEEFGAVPAGDRMRCLIADLDGDTREFAWEQARRAADLAKDCGFAGVVLTGTRFETVVDEGAGWRRGILGAREGGLGR
jgi:5,10-methylenetetrahydrofolate reductase